jgi:tRNA nucleotidyltransferase (CCA-adding enzyme)
VGAETLKLSRAGLPTALLELCQRLNDAGHGAWLVGGCVRDSLRAQLLGPAQPGSWRAKDWDLATDATPQQVMRSFPRVIPTGVDHGTVTVLLPGMQVEVTTLRSEVGYADGRRPDQVAFVSSIEEDLARRDFTVNAIAFEPRAEALIDPFCGLDDLRGRRLRAVGDPARRFAEDGLRVLRAARFVATLEFELDTATASAIRPSLATYRQVSAERIRDEWNKALGAREPSRAFAIMYEHGLLAVSAPELAALGAHSAGAEDQLRLALRRTDRCPARLELRLAALLRELGPSAASSAALSDALLVRLRYSNAERKAVGRALAFRELPLDPEPSDVELRRWLRDVGAGYVDLCTLERADLSARGQAPGADASAQGARLARLERLEQRAAAQLERKPALSLSELAIDGKSLMAELAVPPGPEIGKLLAALLDQVIEQPEANTRESLLERARRLRAETVAGR